jgi:Cell division control protein 14, SIN component
MGMIQQQIRQDFCPNLTCCLGYTLGNGVSFENSSTHGCTSLYLYTVFLPAARVPFLALCPANAFSLLTLFRFRQLSLLHEAMSFGRSQKANTHHQFSGFPKWNKMEALLSHSFDYLASPSPQKIRKGLRQVEGLLAQICLSKASTKADRRQSMLALGSSSPPSPAKPLCDLKDDPAYREFFKLQQGFQWNIAMRLISCLERLMGKGSNGTNDLLIISTLDLIQGALLLHPPSRELFAREIYMNVRRPASQIGSLLLTWDFKDLPRPSGPLQLPCNTIFNPPYSSLVSP